MSFSIQQGKENRRFDGLVLEVGSHATSDLVLDDPVAARAHVVLSLGPRGVTVKPQPTSTGSFLAGELIEEPSAFPVGSELVVGTSRLKLVSFDAAASHASLELRQRSFFHVEKKRGVFRSDADEAVRSEVRFGRFRALRGVNALVILGFLTLLGGWAVGALQGWEERGRVWASPGVLAGAHLAGFMGAGHGAELAGWSAAQLARAESGCAACHVGEPGDYAGEVSCSGCHEQMFRDLGPQGRHPFRGATEVDCRECHRVHGVGASLRGVSFHGQGCSDCHSQSSGELAQLLSDVEGPVMAAPKPRSVGNAGFRHQDHTGQDSVNCATCHQIDAEGRHYSLTGGAELCFGCHGDEAMLAADRVTRGLDGDRPAPVTLTLAEHGRAEGLCVDCHDSVESIEPPVAVLLPPSGEVALAFEVDRHHTGRDQECSLCHLKPLREKPRGRTPAFDHALHVGLDCRSCHYRAELPAELKPESWSEADLQASCVSCHRDGEGALTVAFVAKQGLGLAGPSAGRTAGLARFSHAQHAAGNGCADCHVASQEGEAPGQVVRSARDCASCHYDREVQRHLIPTKVNECSRCHPSADSHSLADLFWDDGLVVAAGGPRAQRASRASGQFSHGLPQHSAVMCTQCHGWEGSVLEVAAAPMARRDYCRDCHQVQRFHWR